MTCGVCIDTDYDGDAAEFVDTKWVTARKAHKCCECNQTIHIGERYECTVGKWERELSTYHTCETCQEIRGAFCCNGYTYTNLWEDASEYLFPYMSIACLDELSTAKAKQVLLDAWNEWKFN